MVEWKVADLNERDFSGKLTGQADVVAAMAVWEHVREPDLLIRNLLALLAPGGLLYLTCPDYGSMARRLMRHRWPYFTPGEHLFMPTAEGAKRCLEAEWHKLGLPGRPQVSARSIAVPYTLRYTLAFMGRRRLAALFPSGLSVPMPTGALEASLIAN
jgi:SAM-dependent methyltransferase